MTVSEAELDQHFMLLALEEGRKALPDCLPNPPVGCVLVRDGMVIGTAHTQPPGLPHAEAGALALVEGELNDITAYVTLEPCSFHGRTPSCAKTLVQRGIGRVVVAMNDPDPRNQGKGIEMLRLMGVPVTVGVCEQEAIVDLSLHLARPDNR
jgi:pyrimidine deaminase RibD-like protein